MLAEKVAEGAFSAPGSLVKPHVGIDVRRTGHGLNSGRSARVARFPSHRRSPGRIQVSPVWARSAQPWNRAGPAESAILTDQPSTRSPANKTGCARRYMRIADRGSAA